MTRKGLGELPVGLFILIVAVALTTGMLGVSNVGAREAVKPVNDLGKLVQAKTQNQVFHNNYLTSAAELSYQNASHEIAKQEGDLTWTSQDMATTGTTYSSGGFYCWFSGSCGGSPRASSIVDTLQSDSDTLLDQYDKSLPNRCQVVNPSFNIELSNQLGFISAEVVASDLSAKVRCENNNIKTQHQFKENYIVTIRPEDNRFYDTFTDTDRYFHDLFEEWNTNVTDTYSARSDTKRCEGATEAMKKNAEADAVGDANSAVRSAWQTVNQEYPSDYYDGLVITQNNLETYTLNLLDTYSGKVFDATGTTGEVNVGGDCPNPCGGEDEPSCKDYYRGTAEITPTQAKVYWTLTDAKYKIPTSAGWKNLNFNVQPYTHDLEEY